MSKDLLKALKERRSIYGISKDHVVSDTRIEELVAEAVQHTPSAFNSQSARVVVLLGEQHDKLWNLTEDALRKVVPAENFTPTKEKMDAFRSGYGTVLFFEDETVVKGLQEQFALYSDNFPIWSQQSSGMLQFVVWTLLDAEGFGATLQHYNPLIDAGIAEEWNIPSTWKLTGQMPFGKPTVTAGEKAFQPLDSRLKVFK
ncbi:nitroreductase family protein [Paenibacillus arenosi]|uniref:Nitroreductase family protein n=1 Tax=Paenibacillus arenosi TaxID=2774142 RepID=A0ABR9AV86_9BACL|nr:nitroreductase family protein [Paenibacillus arenosi]MBD8498040.1 nitroreductase family protein [Paenibacillus arenosi]